MPTLDEINADLTTAFINQKRRGRPPKPKPEIDEDAPVFKKRIGRPPKQKTEAEVKESVASTYTKGSWWGTTAKLDFKKNVDVCLDKFFVKPEIIMTQDYNEYGELIHKPESVGTLDADGEFENKIIKAITFFMSPNRFAVLNGITENALKNYILERTELVAKLRELIFELQIMMNTQVLDTTLDKKNVTDFLFGTGENHFDAWAKLIATDFDISGDTLLLTHAINGGIAKNRQFWQSSTNETKKSFAEVLQNPLYFIQMAFHYIEGTDFIFRNYHKAIFDELELVKTRKTDVLIINIPPRCGKTTIILYWVAQMLMTQPSANVLYTSYGDVVLTFIRKKIGAVFERSREIKSKNETIVNPFFEIFGVSKKEGFAKESDFYTTINSTFFSATVLGSVTGRGASVYGEANGVAVADDLNNPNDVGTVRMETVREKWDTTWDSRRGTNPLVVPSQRVADNDMSAHLIQKYAESDLNVRVLTLPLEMTEEVSEYLSRQQAKYPRITFIDPLKWLKMGETLLDRQLVENIRQTLHPSIYKTQYLQIPTSLEGSLFKSRMFYNCVNSIEPICDRDNRPVGYVKASCEKRVLLDSGYDSTTISFEGVFILHIDTTSGNTDTTTRDVDDCVWTLCIGGLKGRKAGDNYFGAILHQHAINSKQASDVVMQETTLNIIDEIRRVYNQKTNTNVNPYILITLETHAQGGGLASYLRGLNLPNTLVYSYSRQNFGDKKQRFIQASAFFEDRIFWWQYDHNILRLKDSDLSDIITNDWYFESRMQHLSVDGDNTRLHDDYVEATCDLCNLWIAEDKKDIFYQNYMKWRKG